MGRLPKYICRYAGCKSLVDTPSYCEKHKAYGARFLLRPKESSTARGYGARWQRIRKAVLERDHYLCKVCSLVGAITAATEVDHIKPKEIGGDDELVNLQAICRKCHKAKTGKDIQAIKRLRARGI